MMTARQREIVSNNVREYKGFPNADVDYQCSLRLLHTAAARNAVITGFREIYDNAIQRGDINTLAGYDSRGMQLATVLAQATNLAYFPIRKGGKLPVYKTDVARRERGFEIQGTVIRATYEKEYGVDTLEIDTGHIRDGARVLCIDDLLATGGTAGAGQALLEEAKRRTGKEMETYGHFMLVELTDLNGRDYLENLKPNQKIDSLIQM